MSAQSKLNRIFLHKWRPYTWLIILSLAVYAQTLNYGFSPLDDTWILVEKLDYVKDPGNIKQFFSTPLLGAERDYYRPLLTLSFMVDSILGEGKPFYYHLTNILLHAICSILVFILLQKFSISRSKAFLFSLVFAIHPIFVFNVAWIPGRNDILMTIFLILSMLFFLDYHKKGKLIWFIIHLVTMSLALLTKETSVLIPVVALLYAIFFPFNKKYKYFITILSWIVLTGSWFYLRSLVLSDILGISDILSWKTLVNILQSNVIAAGKIFVPVFITGKFPLWIGIISILLLLVSTFFMKIERIKLVLYGIGWFILCITLPAAFKGEFNDWWLYAAMIGVFILIGQLKVAFRNEYIPLFLIMILVGIFVVLTIHRNEIFKDEISFANYYLRSNPDNPTSLYFRGVSHAKNKNHKAAIRDLTKVLELKPGYTNAYYNRAVNYFRLKEFRKSIEDLNYVLKNSPPVPEDYYIRGISYFYIGEFQKAYDDLTICFRLSSQNPMAFYYMGLSCYELGKYDEGLDYLHKARERGCDVNPIVVNRFLDKKMKVVDN